MAYERGMEAAVAVWLKRKHHKVAQQVHLEGRTAQNRRRILDIVAYEYDKTKKVLKVVECKAAFTPRVIEQVEKYRKIIESKPNKFVEATSRKMDMHVGRWMQATDRGHRIRVEFYVVLTDNQCNLQRVHDLTHGRQWLGVMRFKSNGECAVHLRDKNRKKLPIRKVIPLKIPLAGKW